MRVKGDRSGWASSVRPFPIRQRVMKRVDGWRKCRTIRFAVVHAAKSSNAEQWRASVFGAVCVWVCLPPFAYQLRILTLKKKDTAAAAVSALLMLQKKSPLAHEPELYIIRASIAFFEDGLCG